MGWKYYFDGLSQSNGREINMDSMLIKERKIQGKPALLSVICDGVGSLSHGAYAAGRAVQQLAAWFDTVEEISTLSKELERTICWINTQLILDMQSQGFQTASTIAALLLYEGWYWLANAGDSRIYWWADGALTQLTTDTVTPSGKLSMYLGKTECFSIPITNGAMVNGTFLLCSDGLYKRVRFSEIEKELAAVKKGGLKQSMERLVQLAIDRGERDNISIALIRCKAGGLK